MNRRQVQATTRFWRERSESVPMLLQENRALGAEVRRLTAECADLRRLCALQQRRIDGLEAAYGPVELPR